MTAATPAGVAAVSVPARPPGRLSAAVRGLYPGYFALVMATGIISTDAARVRQPGISAALLWVAAIAYAVLFVGTAWRLARHRDALLADARAPARAFALFTFVAGSNVLAARVAAGGRPAVAAALAAAGAAAWLVLTYAIPAGFMLSDRADVLDGINGTWFVWVVGTQSVAIAGTVLAAAYPRGEQVLGATAVVLWSFGAVLYVVVATLVTWRLLARPAPAEGLGPAYWVAMGATAITVLAAARVLGLPAATQALAATRPAIAGVAFLLWAFGTWWIPMLLVFGVWRHAVRRVPLTYEPGLWSMVFPLGMYAAASTAFGQQVGIPFMVTLGRGVFWVALGVWAVTFVGMLVHLARAARGSTATVERPSGDGAMRSVGVG